MEAVAVGVVPSLNGTDYYAWHRNAQGGWLRAANTDRIGPCRRASVPYLRDCAPHREATDRSTIHAKVVTRDWACDCRRGGRRGAIDAGSHDCEYDDESRPTDAVHEADSVVP
jgi:hypothetical protein